MDEVEREPESFQSSSFKRLNEDWTDEEEQGWDALFAQPHMRAGLSKLVDEARQQVVRGDFEEGGLAVE